MNRSIHTVTPPLWSQGQQNSQELHGEGVSHHCNGSVSPRQDSTSAPQSGHTPRGLDPHEEPIPPLCPAALGRGWLPFPILPHSPRAARLPGQMEARTRLGNAARARSLPDNINRAVGHGECCQALIRASCTAGLSPRPSSCSPAPSLQGPRPSAGREKKISRLCISHRQFWDAEEIIWAIPQQQLGKNCSLLLDLREFPRGKWCLGFREFCGRLSSNVAHLWPLSTSRARGLG